MLTKNKSRVNDRAHVKFYQVKIEEGELPDNLRNIWYAGKRGEIFTVCLVAKEFWEGSRARFIVLDDTIPDDDKVFPIHIKTIRPEDCTIVSERVARVPNSFYIGIKNYGRPSINAGKMKGESV